MTRRPRSQDLGAEGVQQVVRRRSGCSTASTSTCAAGESLVIIGGSGTGKSVLIKCILGLLRPEAGSIRIDGEETVGLRRARARAAACANSACCSRARRCSIRCRSGRMSPSAWSRAAAWSAPRRSDIALEKLAAVGLGRRVSRCCGRPNCPAACKSASRSPARSPPSRKSFSSTSRPPGSIRSWPT